MKGEGLFMVTIKNDCILVTKDDPSFSILRSDLTFFESGVRRIYKKRKDGGTYVINQEYSNTDKLFHIYNNGISIPRGLLFYVKPYFKNSSIEDRQNKSKFYDIKFNISDFNEYSTILDGITLTNEQLISIRKIIMCKRCIIQSATGCFTGDTRVPLLNGTSKSFEELINMNYKDEYVYTCTKNGDISYSKIKSVHITKYVNKLLRITLDDNSIIHCTPEHPFMLRNGEYKQAKNLCTTDSLMPYDCVLDSHGNKAIKHNKYCAEKGRYYRGNICVYRMVYSTENNIVIPKRYDIHHKDINHYNDNPENLEMMSHYDHLSYHNNSKKATMAVHIAWDKHNTKMKRSAINNIIKYNKSDKGRNESVKRAEYMRNLQNNYKSENLELFHLKRSIVTMKSNCTRYHNDYPGNCKICRDKFNNLINKARSIDPNFESWNHKVKKIETIELEEPIPVYDLETESDLHNFAIQTSFKDDNHEFIGSGIFVHNSGKTEIMCGFLKILNDKFGEYPTTLIVEPAVTLLNKTIERLDNYGIPVSNYRKERTIIKGKVNLCHPKSLVNDLKNDSDLLKDVNVVLGDEVHHMKSILFRTPTDNANGIDYSIGLSASAIKIDNVGKLKLVDYDKDELNIIGSTGPLVMNLTSGKLIDKGTLATPAVLVMNNLADEPIPELEVANWHRIVSDKLYSSNRTLMTCQTAEFFSDKMRKVLILVNTIEWSRIIMKCMYKINPAVELFSMRASYGGERFEYFNGEEFISDDSDVLDKFSNGDYQILIGTSHLYEGIDVTNLDVIILAFGGKKERMMSQGVGRVLRKTKNGKYAYIVDFNDKCDVVLSKQFKARNKMYREVMNVPDNLYFNNVEVDELEGIFNKLEN